MFYRKSERKSHNVRVILTVGALATVGAISIFKCTRQMLGDTFCKIKSFLKSEKAMCPEKIENDQQ